MKGGEGERMGLSKEIGWGRGAGDREQRSLEERGCEKGLNCKKDEGLRGWNELAVLRNRRAKRVQEIDTTKMMETALNHEREIELKTKKWRGQDLMMVLGFVKRQRQCDRETNDGKESKGWDWGGGWQGS